MRHAAWMIAATLLPAAAQAQAVRVAMGEEASFTLKDGAPTGEKRAKATPNSFEARAGAQLSGQTPPAGVVTQGTPIGREAGPVPQADPNTVRVRFVPVAGTDHSVLGIYNGYDQGLVYRARITVNGRTGPTDVCLVMPGKAGIEHWPYAIEAIEVSDFALVDWKPEDGVPCK